VEGKITTTPNSTQVRGYQKLFYYLIDNYYSHGIGISKIKNTITVTFTINKLLATKSLHTHIYTIEIEFLLAFLL
jgi:hypothetical protein